jgi:hypothetical protein
VNTSKEHNLLARILRRIPRFAWILDHDGAWMRTLWCCDELMTPLGWKWVGTNTGYLSVGEGERWQFKNPTGKLCLWPPNVVYPRNTP